MEQLGIDFNATGSVMSKEQLEEQRRKRGECLTCGRKCYQKKVFKMIPITDHGRVLNGRCLNCNPLKAKKGSEVLPAVARPATQQDLERIKSQSSRHLMGGPGEPRRASLEHSSRQPSSQNPMRRSGPGPSMAHDVGLTESSSGADAQLDTSQTSGTQQLPTVTANASNQFSPGVASSPVADRVSSSPTVTRQRRSTAAIPASRPQSSSSAFTEDRELSSSGRNARTRSPGSARKQPHNRSRPASVDGSSNHSRKSSGRPKTTGETEQNGQHTYDRNSIDAEHDEAIHHHGVLDRGGIAQFSADSPPLGAAMMAESSRTLSSMSSIEEEGHHIPRRSNKKYAESKSGSAIHNDNGDSSEQSGTRRSKSPNDRRHSFASKTPEVSTASLMSASSQRSQRNQQDGTEQRALQRIQRAQGDYKEIVRVMKKHPSSEVIQQEAFKSLSNCHFSRDDYAELSKLKTAPAVIKGMKSHPRASEVQVNGCRAVWNLSATSKSQLELMDHGALEVVLEAMDDFPDDAEVQETAMAALSNLGAVEASQEAILQSGAIDKIVAAMNKHSGDGQVQMKGCAAITNLASHDSPLKTAIVQAGGGGAVVVSMVMHTDEVELQEKALRALRNICANSEENKVEVAKVGGIDAVITAMQVHRDEAAIQEAGAWTLSNLAQNSDNKAVIGDSGGIDVIVRAMWVHSGNVGVNEWCCRALLSLSTDVQNRMVTLEVGGISAMVNAMQAHTDSATVQEKCCSTLSNLAALDEDTKLRIVDEEAIDAIVMAMVLHPENRNVQDRACSVLRRLAIPDNVKQMQASNVAELVRAAMDRFPDKCGDKGRAILVVL